MSKGRGRQGGAKGYLPSLLPESVLLDPSRPAVARLIVVMVQARHTVAHRSWLHRTSRPARHASRRVRRSACAPARAKHRHGSQGQVRCTGSVVVLTRQRRLPFLHVLPTLVEDLLDIVGRSYDGIDYVVLNDIHETMLDPGESDHPLAAVGVVAQTPRDVAANIYLHTRSAEVMSP